MKITLVIEVSESDWIAEYGTSSASVRKDIISGITSDLRSLPVGVNVVSAK